MSYLLNKYAEWRASGKSNFDGDILDECKRFSRFAGLTETIPEFELRKLAHEYDQRMN
ncbi:MAG: hypothetical protein ACOX3Q_00845 [Clostridia bacterium]|jgi:hypothetical protein|nr:hypothetical protein [Clostridiaceae bacterium]